MLTWIAGSAELCRRVPPDDLSDVGRFPRREVAAWPAGRTDPQMGRMLRKLDLTRGA